MDFTKFFAPPQAPAKKRRATKAKPPPKRLKQDSPPLPPKFAALLTQYDQLRQVARSLEAMRVRTTLAQLCGAVPQLRLSEETVRTCALACPRVLTVDDSDGTALVVFPKLSDSDRKRGSTYEAARRQTLESSLREQADAAHACWLAQRSLEPPLNGYHADFDGGPPIGRAPPLPPPSPAKIKPPPPTDALLPLQRLAGEAWYEGQAVRVETLEKRPGRYASITKELPDQVRRFVEPLRLYEHQAKAIDASLGGADVALATGTASGKTLSYVVPALCAASETDGCVALFLFPTKALAQDQLASLKRAIEACSLQATCATLDGDTPDEERQSIAQSPSTFIITNPDMLHYTLLPGASQRWRRLFDDLRYVVVDESHVYVGGFGADSASFPKFKLRRWRLHDHTRVFMLHRRARRRGVATSTKIGAVLSILCVFRYGPRRVRPRLGTVTALVAPAGCD